MNVNELDAARRETLLAGARRRTVARADVVFAAGDDAKDVFVVESGRIKLVRANRAGAESIVGILGPGDVFGEAAPLFAQPARDHSAIALDPGKVARIAAAQFRERVTADPELAAEFARGLALRLGAVERELTELAGKSVAGRLVDALGRLAAAHGESEPGGGLRIALALTHKDLADLIGTSRETLTRELGVLADVGLVRVAQRSIVLVQPQAFPLGKRRT